MPAQVVTGCGQFMRNIQQEKQSLHCDCCAPLTALVPPCAQHTTTPQEGTFPGIPVATPRFGKAGMGRTDGRAVVPWAGCPWVSPHGAVAVPSNHRLDSEGTTGKRSVICSSAPGRNSPHYRIPSGKGKTTFSHS